MSERTYLLDWYKNYYLKDEQAQKRALFSKALFERRLRVRLLTTTNDSDENRRLVQNAVDLWVSSETERPSVVLEFFVDDDDDDDDVDMEITLLAAEDTTGGERVSPFFEYSYAVGEAFGFMRYTTTPLVASDGTTHNPAGSSPPTDASRRAPEGEFRKLRSNRPAKARRRWTSSR